MWSIWGAWLGDMVGVGTSTFDSGAGETKFLLDLAEAGGSGIAVLETGDGGDISPVNLSFFSMNSFCL